jgi:signal transduction histidine kinase
MVLATISKNKNNRLHDLYENILLETSRDDEFGEIVKLASSLCDMPISFINLIDSKGQWFKVASVGVNNAQANTDGYFCNHAILQDTLFEVTDISKDNRFCNDKLVMDRPTLRYYAGVPLITSSGSRLGTLCVIDKIPRHLTEKQKFGLKVLADNVVKIIELRLKNKELDYSAETQKKIISILAHDVRNPLSSIKNIIELKKSDIIDAKDAAELINMVTEQLDNTIEMIENILNWGQMHLQFGHIQLEDFDLNELVERIFGSESLNSVVKKNQLINQIEPGTIVNCDKQSLEFILRNLVSNANKFTQNGRILIGMKEKDAKTTIWVTDNGVGISDERAGELLNKSVYNTTLGTNNERGSGLGLLLVKEFIDRMDGTITFESELGKGTTFKITI